MTAPTPRSLVVAALLTLIAQPAAAQLSRTAAGEYATVVSLDSSSCPGIEVQSRATIVTHAAGDSALTLTHAGLTYQGIVRPDGSFTMTPRAVNAGDETHTLRIAGRFASNLLDARVDVDLTRGTGPVACRYHVKWKGSRPAGDGSP